MKEPEQSGTPRDRPTESTDLDLRGFTEIIELV